jgi:hypothetical protein
MYRAFLVQFYYHVQESSGVAHLSLCLLGRLPSHHAVLHVYPIIAWRQIEGRECADLEVASLIFFFLLLGHKREMSGRRAARGDGSQMPRLASWVRVMTTPQHSARCVENGEV